MKHVQSAKMKTIVSISMHIFFWVAILVTLTIIMGMNVLYLSPFLLAMIYITYIVIKIQFKFLHKMTLIESKYNKDINDALLEVQSEIRISEGILTPSNPSPVHRNKGVSTVYGRVGTGSAARHEKNQRKLLELFRNIESEFLSQTK